MITLELPPDVEARLAAEAEARGLDMATCVAQLLRNVAAHAGTGVPRRTREQFHAWLEEFTQVCEPIPAVSGETFSREMIYQDHD